jgi:hypothetical protein
LLEALRRLVRGMEETNRGRMLGTAGVRVRAGVVEPGQCSICGGDAWKVQKTVSRHGLTIAHGAFEAQETVLECASRCRHPSGSLEIRKALAGRLVPSRTVGYDVVAFVGTERFLHHRQREEIRTALESKHGITISSGEVSDLQKLFVEYFGRLHRDRSEQLRKALESDGGWPMHVDATGEHGRGTLFVVMAGWRQWVLGAWKPATEKAELLAPCLRETVRRFGAPCAAMRDLGRAVTPAIDGLVKDLGLRIPVLACHQHFLADVGKDLLDPSHGELRELFRRWKVRPNLRELVRDLGRRISEGIAEARKAVVDWQSIADEGHRVPPGRDGLAVVRGMGQWALDYATEASGLDFPFDRPYLDLYDRCLTTLRATDAFLRTPPDDQKVVKALKRLHRRLTPVASDVPFRQITNRLRRRAVLFDEMRNVLRFADVTQEDETEQDLESMRSLLDKWVASLGERRPQRGPAQDLREAIDIIVEHVERHGKNLWGHAIPLPESAGGGIRLVSRTNFLLENHFKRLKHCERQRSGRRILTKDLENLPAEAALVYNLERDDYVNIVCGSLDQLPQAFAQLDREERDRRRTGDPPSDEDDVGTILQLATASLSTPDRRVIRTEAMDRRMRAAAGSRPPQMADLTPRGRNPTGS